MSDTLEAVRLYGEAWGETDAEARACLLARALVEDAVYVDPTLDTATRAALSEGIGQFQTSTPGAAIVLASGVDARAGELRFAWDFTLNGVTAVKGIDYVEVAADGRLASVSGLWDPVPTDAPTGALAAWVAAWTATDAAARDASLAAALAPSFRYTDGDVDLGAAAALSAHIASAAASVTLVGAQAYPKRARLAFDLGGSREATDFFFLDADGRITRAARFAGPLPSP